MIEAFKDKSGDFVIRSTCLDVDSFMLDLSEVLSKVISQSKDGTSDALGVLTNAVPIMYKLSGYKAETVREQRVLICGNPSPDAANLICTAGK